ncbi:MAG: hypothetical protein KC503_40315 [Myxococcales bacterium]|nr:hypothetical protein [Myxococcales bacterium]
MRWRGILLLGVALCALLIPLDADARRRRRRRRYRRGGGKRVVVMKFAGGRSGLRARNGFVRGIRRRTRLVSASRFVDRADDLGLDPNSPRGRSGACHKLKCHAIVRGSVRRAGRSYVVTVTVYNALDGQAIGKRAARVRGARRLVRAGVALGRACLRLIGRGRIPSGAPAAAPKPPPPTPPPPAPVARTPDPDPPPARVKKRRRNDDDDDDDGDGVRRSASRGSKAGLVSLGVSIGLSTRTYELAGANPAQNSKYDGGLFPEFRLLADLYPLVPFVKNFARNVGIGVSYARHITISTKLPANSDEVDTSSQQFIVDLRVRWAFLKKPTSPVALIRAGFGLRDFNLGANTVLTSFNYQFLQFGLDGYVPLGTPLIALHAGFDVRPLLKIGKEAVDSYGSRVGGLGFAVRAGAYGTHRSGVFYFLTFEYLSFSAEFAGLDASQVRGQTPDRAEATTGSDRYIRLWAGGGYRYDL